MVPPPSGARSVSPCRTRTRSAATPISLGDDCRERRLVGLPVWRRADHDRHGAVVLDCDRRALALPAARDLDGAADADAKTQRARRVSRSSACSTRNAVVARGLDAAVERLCIAAAVVRGADRGRVRKRVGRHEVAPAHLDGVEADPRCVAIDRPLDVAPDASGRPAPRKAIVDAVFVTTERPLTRAAGMSYTPVPELRRLVVMNVPMAG